MRFAIRTLRSISLGVAAASMLLGAPSAARADDTIVLGAAISITGKTAKEGEYTRDGYQFAIDVINKEGGVKVGGKTYKLALKAYDDESKSERTAQLFEKLVNEDKVQFLLGPYGSGPTGTAAPIAEKYKLPMIEANGAAESIFSKGYKYTFGVLSPAKLYLRGVIDFVLAKDPTAKTVAILGENEPFSKEVVTGSAEYAKSKGMEVVYQELYPSSTQDVSALLTSIKGKHPHIVLGAGHLQDTLLIVKQAKDLGIAPRAMGFSVGPSSPEFRESLKQNADYLLGATQWTSALKYTGGQDPWKTPGAYAQAFLAGHASYKVVPYQVAESSAAIVTYKLAIEKAGTLDPAKVRDAIAGLDVMTFYGQIKFDDRGVNIYKPMAVEQLYPDGKKYTVFPTSVAEKPGLYPIPGAAK